MSAKSKISKHSVLCRHRRIPSQEPRATAKPVKWFRRRRLLSSVSVIRQKKYRNRSCSNKQTTGKCGHTLYMRICVCAVRLLFRMMYCTIKPGICQEGKNRMKSRASAVCDGNFTIYFSLFFQFFYTLPCDSLFDSQTIFYYVIYIYLFYLIIAQYLCIFNYISI